MLPSLAVAAALAALAVAAPAARAGIADAPVPTGTNYLFSVPGVINANGLGTFFTCSSVSTASQTVTIEVWDQDNCERHALRGAMRLDPVYTPR